MVLALFLIYNNFNILVLKFCRYIHLQSREYVLMYFDLVIRYQVYFESVIHYVSFTSVKPIYFFFLSTKLNC